MFPFLRCVRPLWSLFCLLSRSALCFSHLSVFFTYFSQCFRFVFSGVCLSCDHGWITRGSVNISTIHQSSILTEHDTFGAISTAGMCAERAETGWSGDYYHFYCFPFRISPRFLEPVVTDVDSSFPTIATTPYMCHLDTIFPRCITNRKLGWFQR